MMKSQVWLLTRLHLHVASIWRETLLSVCLPSTTYMQSSDYYLLKPMDRQIVDIIKLFVCLFSTLVDVGSVWRERTKSTWDDDDDEDSSSRSAFSTTRSQATRSHTSSHVLVLRICREPLIREGEAPKVLWRVSIVGCCVSMLYYLLYVLRALCIQWYWYILAMRSYS